MVDLLKGDLARIRKRVGAADYQKIDAHLEGVLAIERRILPPPTTPTSVGCTIPPSPMNLTANNANYPAQVTQMMDIATNILACDVTRVLTLQLARGFSNVTHTWLGHTSAHHTMSHDGVDRRTELTAIDDWYAKQVAYFLAKLDAVNEGTGTLLDNTLLVWGRELGNTSHNMGRAPFIIARQGGRRAAHRPLPELRQAGARQAAGQHRASDGHVDPHLRRQPRHEQRPPHRPPRLTLPPSPALRERAGVRASLARGDAFWGAGPSP